MSLPELNSVPFPPAINETSAPSAFPGGAVPAANLTWQHHRVSRQNREKLHGHPGFVIWFTGLSSSGKSTVARSVEEALHGQGYSTYILDGDNVRHGLCADLGFDNADRVENIRRIGELSRLFVDAGVIVLVAIISPFQRDREMVRSLFSSQDFLEVYMKCPVGVCESRDEKGVYARARNGEIVQFTGISSPYEEPLFPEITCQTDHENRVESVNKVLRVIEERVGIKTPRILESV